ncbi:MAG TPA: TonB family protein [Opitutaceae bacterium]|jgi:TonB family protein
MDYLELPPQPPERPPPPPPRRQMAVEVDVSAASKSGRAKWVVRIGIAAILLACAATWFIRTNSARQSAQSVAEVEAKIINFPLDSDDALIADFTTQLAAATASVSLEDGDRLNQIWRTRRAEILEMRSKTAVQSAASQRGTFTIRATPANAEIIFDNAPPQKAPVTLSGLSFGPHSYEVRAPGYDSLKRSVTIGDSTSLSTDATLVRATGTLKLSSTPQDAAWTVRGLDGSEFRQEGFAGSELKVPSGRYSVKFSRPGDPSLEEFVTVDAQTGAVCNGVFPEGLISFETNSDSPVAITVDGIWRGQTPIIVTLPAGEHVLDAEFGDGTKDQRRIMVLNQERLHLTLRSKLPPAPKLTIPSVAATAPTPQPAGAAAVKPMAALTPVVSLPYDAIYTLAEVQVRPEPWKKIRPNLTPGFAEKGNVDVEVIIDRDGSVLSAHVIHSTDSSLNDPTVEAVKDWKFHPAMRFGLPVMVRALLPVVFTEKPTSELR